jgi:hypothetical protein
MHCSVHFKVTLWINRRVCADAYVCVRGPKRVRADASCVRMDAGPIGVDVGHVRAEWKFLFFYFLFISLPCECGKRKRIFFFKFYLFIFNPVRTDAGRKIK